MSPFDGPTSRDRLAARALARCAGPVPGMPRRRSSRRRHRPARYGRPAAPTTRPTARACRPAARPRSSVCSRTPRAVACVPAGVAARSSGGAPRRGRRATARRGGRPARVRRRTPRLPAHRRAPGRTRSAGHDGTATDLSAAGDLVARAPDAQHAHRHRHHADRRAGAGARRDRGRLRDADRARRAHGHPHRPAARVVALSVGRHGAGRAVRGAHQRRARQPRRRSAFRWRRWC